MVGVGVIVWVGLGVDVGSGVTNSMASPQAGSTRLKAKMLIKKDHVLLSMDAISIPFAQILFWPNEGVLLHVALKKV